MKRMSVLISLLGVAVATFLTSGTMLQTAEAADAVNLSPGKNTTFPTWGFGRTTRLCAQSVDNKGSKVLIKVANAQESVVVNLGQTNCIDRSWQAVPIVVINTGLGTIKVWTSIKEQSEFLAVTRERGERKL